MEAADIDLLVVGREGNARYVSGAPRLWTAGSRAFGPGCVLVRASGSVHLLSTWDEGIPDDIPHENLYGISFNAGNFLKVLQGIEGAATVRTVATDAMTPSAARLLPKAFPSAQLIDGEPLLRRARRVKTPEEVDAIRASVRIAERALDEAAAALAPGCHGAAAHGRVHAGHGVGRRHHSGEPGRRVDHVEPAPMAAREPGHAGSAGRSGGVRGRSDARRVRRRARPDALGRWRRGHRSPTGPALRRALGSSSRRVPGGGSAERSPRRLRSAQGSHFPPCRWREDWGSGTTSLS